MLPGYEAGKNPNGVRGGGMIDLEDLAAAIDGAASRQAGDQGEVDDLALARLPKNDMGNAERLRARSGQDLIYVPGADWFVWDGRRFARGTRTRDTQSPEATRCVHQMVKAIPREAAVMAEFLRQDLERAVAGGEMDGPKEIAARQKLNDEWVQSHRKWAVSSGNSAKIAGALAQARPYLTRLADGLDVDPWLLNLQNGTLDLRPDTREGYEADTPDGGYDGCSDRPPPPLPVLRAHDRADYLTSLAPVAYDARAQAPRWEDFMSMIQPDEEIRLYLQRLAGYTITGSTGEQVFAVHWGNGQNGKSTFAQVIGGLLGDYASIVKPAVFMANGQQDGDKAQPGLAKLRAKRFVSASEPSEDAKLGEDLIKAVTGQDKVPVRDLFETEIDMPVAWKLWLDTNFKPNIRGLDLGIWRRVHLIPYLEKIPEGKKIKDFHKILIAQEGPGVLNWCVQGMRQWLERGLDPPRAVLDAVDEYKREMDPLSDFLDQATEVVTDDPGCTATELYHAYCYWSEQAARTPMTSNAFGRQMTKRGRGSRKVEGINRYRETVIVRDAWPPHDWIPPVERKGGGGKTHRDGGGGLWAGT